MAVEDEELQVAGGPSGDAVAAQDQADAFERDFGNRGTIANKDRNVSPLKNPAKGKLGLSGRRKIFAAVAGGGGIIGLLVGAYLAILPLKLEHVMQNMEQHFFARSKHTQEARMKLYVREALRTKYFANPSTPFNDQTASLTQRIADRFGKGLRVRLDQEGAKITIQNDISHLGHKIVTIDRDGEKTTYRTYDQKTVGRQDMVQLSKDITKDDGWIKRLYYKRLLTDRTGTKWHWLDPITQPINKAKIAAANAVAEFLLSSSSKAAEAGAALLDSILGGTDQHKQLSDALSNASDGEQVKIIASELTKQAMKVGTGVGAAISAVEIYCGVTHFIESDELHKIAQKKAEIEYATEYAANISKSSQFKEGKTNGTAVAASMALLTSGPDKNGKTHDITESNDYKRATGQNVAYHPTDDCSSTAELCQSKLPSKLGDQNAIGGAFSTLHDITNNTVYKILGSIAPLPIAAVTPGSFVNDAACAAFKTAVSTPLKFAAGGLDALVSVIPGIGSLWGDFKNASADAVSAVGEGLISKLIPPVVDASTVGPALGHAVAIGGDIAGNVAQGSPAASDATGTENDCYHGSADQKASDSSMCGHKLTHDELVQVDLAMQAEQENDFQHLTLWQKVASLDAPQSLASKFLDATPSSPKLALQDASSSFASLLNPREWSHFAQWLTDLFSGKARATGPETDGFIVNSDGTDQFGEPQYGFSEAENNAPLGDPAMANADRNAGCSAIAGLTDSDGNPIDEPGECAQFNNQASSSTQGSLPTGTAQQLAQDLLTHSGVGYEGTAQTDIQDAANGKPGTCNTPVAESLLALLDYLAKAGHTFHISAVESACQGHAGGAADPHYQGRAADITQVDGDPAVQTNGVGRSANDVKVMQEIAPLMPQSPNTGDWTKWSGFGQLGCGPEPDPTLPGGIQQFKDINCNHLHIQVAQ